MKFIFGKFAMIFFTVLFCFGLAFAQAETETGIGLYGKGEYEKAVKPLQKAVKENKNDRRAWLDDKPVSVIKIVQYNFSLY